MAGMLTSVLGAQRSGAVEVADGGGDAMRMSGLEPAGIFLGKAGALAIELAVLEVFLFGGVVLLYNLDVRASGVAVIAFTCLATTIGLAAASTIYGALAAGQRVRDTLLPRVILPVLAPDAPWKMSCLSMSSVFRPRMAQSSATPLPLTPPPTTRTS